MTDERCPTCERGTLQRVEDSRQPSPEEARDEPTTSWTMVCDGCGATWREDSTGLRVPDHPPRGT